MNEFALIEAIVAALGERAQGPWLRLGPGDDGAVMATSAGHEAVASIDTLVAGLHFPATAPAKLIGYRALMVSVSDLAAMGADPRYALIALTMPAADLDWATDLALGMAEAAECVGIYVCGGNLARGPLNISVSVHGEVPDGRAVKRMGAAHGDGVFVSGSLGGAGSCVRQQDFAVHGALTPTQQRYYRPRARTDLVGVLRGHASACIDVSDGLVQDLWHICRACKVGVYLDSTRIPIFDGATLQDALYGGDDYELACTASAELEGFIRVGEVKVGEGKVTDGVGVWLDGAPLEPQGFEHFRA